MTKLTDEEKRARKVQRTVDRFRTLRIGKCINETARQFQKMIRAEAGADHRACVPVVVNGEIAEVRRTVGQCVCITCGKVQAWDSGIKGIHTGHFLGSRCNAILLEEANVAPQCSHCNYYRSGAPQAFRLWMEHVRGLEEIERLQRLKTTTRQFTRDELAELKVNYQGRLNDALSQMQR